MSGDTDSIISGSDSEDSWEVLREGTRDSFGLPKMIPELFELLGNTQPSTNEDQGGLDISVEFITWLERNNVIDFTGLIDFGEKEYIEYFKMVDDINDIKKHLIDMKRIRSLSLYWRDIQRTNQSKLSTTFTKQDFVWDKWNDLHQDSHKSMNGRFSKAKKTFRRLHDKKKGHDAEPKTSIFTQRRLTSAKHIDNEDSLYAFKEAKKGHEDNALLRRLQNPSTYTDQTNLSKVIIRRQLPATILWNGDYTKFDKFQIDFESFLIQAGMGYACNERFLILYDSVSVKVLTELPHLNLTLLQLKYDRMTVYGALRQACGDGIGRTIIAEFDATQDGFLAWMRMLDTMVHDQGIRQIRTMYYRQILMRRYDPQYPRGLRGFCNDYITAYQGLAKLKIIVNEEDKMNTFLLHLYHPYPPHDTSMLCSYCSAHFSTFQEITQHVIAESIKVDFHNHNATTRQANTMSVASHNPFHHIHQDISAASPPLMMLATTSNKTSPSQDIMAKYKLPIEAWKLLSDDSKYEFIVQRNKQLNLRIPSKDQFLARLRSRSSLPTPSIPQQYQPVAANTITVSTPSNNDDITDEIPDASPDSRLTYLMHQAQIHSDPDEDDDEHVFTPQLFNLTTIRVTTSHFDAFIGTLNTDTSYSYAVSDGGADTSLLGSGWYIYAHTQRKANVIGFDKKTAYKQHLSICSGATIVKLADGREQMVVIHEGVSNPDSDLTLLSEFQLRTHGCIVDPVSKSHKLNEHLYGTQRIVTPSGQEIPLAIMSALATMEHRLPLENEIETQLSDAWVLTSDMTWDPKSFYDDKNCLTSDSMSFLEPSSTSPDNISVIQSIDNAHVINTATTTTNVDIPKTLVSDYMPQVDNDHTSLYVFGFTADQYPVDVEPIDAMPNTLLSTPSMTAYAHCMSMDDSTDTTPQVSNIHTVTTERSIEDLKKLQPFLGYLPLRVIRNTLANTTQLAKQIIRFPLRRHIKTRFPILNKPRLREIVATDTFFANCASTDGYTCAQVFYGLTSQCINVYGMKSEHEGFARYQDFLREQGAPYGLRRDNSKMQTSTKFTDLNREYLIEDQFTEPYHPQQNPSEKNGVHWLKDHSQILLDRVGAPPFVWYDAVSYLADLHNVTSHDSLRGRTPHERRHGDTPDISAFLQFRFYDKILYLDPSETYPASKEKPGRFLGVARNVGDLLTFRILDDATEKVLFRSVVRSVTPMNKRVRFDPTLTSNYEPAFASPTSNASAISSPEPLLSNTPFQFGPNKLKVDSTLSRIQYKRDKRRTLRQTRRGKRDKQNKIPQHDTSSPDASSSMQQSAPPTLDSVMHATPTTNPTPDEPSVPSIRRSERIKGKSSRQLLHSLISLFSLSVILFDTHDIRPASTNHLHMFSSHSTGGIPQHTDNTSHNTEEHQSPESIDPMFMSLTDHMYRPETSDLLVYHRHLDMLNEANDDHGNDDMMWIIRMITDHSRFRIRGTYHSFVRVLWYNGESSWLRQDILRQDHPYELIQYALRKQLVNKSDWKWIIDFLKDDRNFTATYDPRKVYNINVNAPRFKFGIEVPRSVRHALMLDKQNGNNEWQNAINKELKQIQEYETFRVLEDDEFLDDTYKLIPYHIVFDVKFDLRRKARLVAGGHKTNPPKEDVYSGVVSMDTVRLGFLIAALNNMTVVAADIGNAFLYGTTKEKVYVRAGPEFGPEVQGKRLLIVKSLYGLRTSAARFHEHLTETLRKLGFVPSYADADLWLKENDDHYEYIATYVDDIMIFSREPMKYIKEFEKIYILKGVGAPEYYLGGNVENLTDMWNFIDIDKALSARTYIVNVTQKLEQMMGYEFKHAKTPMADGYHPELDESDILNPVEASKYRALIGSANWVVLLGRFDIAYATNTLARYSMQPRLGHMQAIVRLFGYLKRCTKGKIVIDQYQLDLSAVRYANASDWSQFYPDAKEDIPPNMPTPKGLPAHITVFVDADHAHDKLTCRSITGILVFINGTPIRALSKRQKTVESSTYGSEMVAGRVATELIMELRYNLRMLGIPIPGPSTMIGDNRSVIVNTTIPSSMLKKKHNAIAYHRIREAVAANIIRFGHLPGDFNYADVMTKPLNKDSFHSLVQPLFFRQPSTSMILIDPAEISTTDPLLSHDHDDPILLEPFPVIDPASE